jgi:hypothetical protein
VCPVDMCVCVHLERDFAKDVADGFCRVLFDLFWSVD